jgi:hypothetical protein
VSRDPKDSSSAGPWGEPDDPTSAMPTFGQGPNGHGSGRPGPADQPPWEQPRPSFTPQPQQPAQPQSRQTPQSSQAGYGQQGYGGPPWQEQPGDVPPGYDQPGYDQPGYVPPGYDQPGYDQQGYNANQQGRHGQPGLGPFGPRPEGTGTTPTWTVGSGGGPGGHRRPESKPARPPRKRRRLLWSVIGGAVAVIVVIAVVAVTMLKHNGPGTPTYGMIPTGSTPQADGAQITTAFLQAWESGNLTTAANLTSRHAAALAYLTANAKDLDLGKMTATTGSVTDAAGSTSAAPRETVKFTVDASVAARDGKKLVRGPWDYSSTLTAYQQASSSVWFVDWRPDVVAPHLTASTHLAAVAVPPTVGLVTDASGEGLTTFGDAGLSNIAADLSKIPPPGQGKPGLDVQIETAAGKAVANSQAIVISPDNIPSITTTITTADETAARAAVAMHKNSSMVVIQPSTGDILAVANNAGFNDFALTAAVAPGSSMKIITSTALFNSGRISPQSPVVCPPTYTIQGVTYHNDQNESEGPATPFLTDFALSCNNAFTTQEPYLYGKLASTAKTYYGLDQNWDIGLGGVSASYFNAPANASGAELAQEAFGEGKLTASPLAMASIAATVDYGSFKQPILVPGTKQLTATALPASTDADLKTVMRAVVTQGTAAGLGFGPDVYAKTGTADIIGQEQPNSWLVAFDPSKDVAVADLVLNAGYGAQFAGPEVKYFLDNS